LEVSYRRRVRSKVLEDEVCYSECTNRHQSQLARACRIHPAADYGRAERANRADDDERSDRFANVSVPPTPVTRAETRSGDFLKKD